MSKLGFVQDLCDGIDRYTRAAKHFRKRLPRPPFPYRWGRQYGARLAFLEEAVFKRRAIIWSGFSTSAPSEPRAYLGKLMVEYGVKQEQELAGVTGRIECSSTFANAKKFGDATLGCAFKRLCRRYRGRSKSR